MIKMTAANNNVITCLNSVFYITRGGPIYSLKLDPNYQRWEIYRGEDRAGTANSIEEAMVKINQHLDRKEEHGE